MQQRSSLIELGSFHHLDSQLVIASYLSLPPDHQFDCVSGNISLSREVTNLPIQKTSILRAPANHVLISLPLPSLAILISWLRDS